MTACRGELNSYLGRAVEMLTDRRAERIPWREGPRPCEQRGLGRTSTSGLSCEAVLMATTDHWLSRGLVGHAETRAVIRDGIRFDHYRDNTTP